MTTRNTRRLRTLLSGIALLALLTLGTPIAPAFTAGTGLSLVPAVGPLVAGGGNWGG
jgi:hypothetical protein